MAAPLLTQFEPDEGLLAVLADATMHGSQRKKAAKFDWPGNILSTKMVIYADGTIARRDDPVLFAVEPEELALCRRLAGEVVRMMEGAPVVGGAGFTPFGPFYNAAQVGAAVPTKIDGALIRARFGETIIPEAKVAIEPMAESGDWWKEVAEVLGDDGEGLERWKEMIRWFRSRPEFIDTAFVRIGDNFEGKTGRPDERGAEYFGVVMPRLALGLTARGSLAGLGGTAAKA